VDLKLGRRNYLEDIHTPYKVLLRTVKSSATTAKDFGFRVGGLKVYRPRTASFVVRQKAWGNQLKRKDLHKAIHMYLHDGVRTRVDVIPHLITRLKSLANALEKQTTFSFMASSVLLIYEGDSTSEQAVDHQRIDVRLIDFDHTMIRDGNAKDIAGVIFGVKNLIRVLKRLLFSEQMSHSETDILAFRQTTTREKVTSDADGAETVSAAEPAVFSERHLPYPLTRAASSTRTTSHSSSRATTSHATTSLQAMSYELPNHSKFVVGDDAAEESTEETTATSSPFIEKSKNGVHQPQGTLVPLKQCN